MSHPNLTARARIKIRKPRSEVFDAFADAKAMSAFWFNRRDERLRAGETVTWYLGSDEDAMAFDVHVKELDAPEKIVIEWAGHDGHLTQVTWLFEESENGETILTIEESGFRGDPDAIIERVLDSTGGFNQVIVAAKAYVEYGAHLNVVNDHVF